MKKYFLLITFLVLVFSFKIQAKEFDTNEVMKERYSIQEIFIEEVECELSFYTSLSECNSDINVGKTATGYLKNTSIAIPRGSMPYGSLVILEDLPNQLEGDYGANTIYERIADDCGSPSHIRIKNNGVYRFDVYCPRLESETETQYKSRINSYGKFKTKAKIIIDIERE